MLPEYLRTLVVILVLASGAFLVAKAPACDMAMGRTDYERRRNLWFALTLAVFLAHNFWIFMIAAAVLLLFATSREPNKLALFYFVLLTVPAIRTEIPFFGGIRYLFPIDYLRLLALAVLLPAFLQARHDSGREPFGRLLADKFLACYMVLGVLLTLYYASFTNALRETLLAFIDVFLPYYVASRSMKTAAQARDALMAFALGAFVMALVAIFEFGKGWLLYAPVDDQLGVQWNLGRYLSRGDGGSLRALGTTGQPIVLGYVMAVAIGFCLFLRPYIRNPAIWWAALLVLLCGLIAPVSRGPWLGAAAMVLIFIALGPSPGTNLMKLALAGIVAAPLLLLTPVGDKIIAYLPFVGSVEEQTVTYRQRLFELSVQVIANRPFFGAPDYYDLAVMDELRTGTGFIDMVNSFLGIGLSRGLVGLFFFCGFFVVVLFAIWKAMRKIPNRSDEHYLLGRTLLATLIGILIIIFTVSSITVIPWIYWSVAGLGVAYARMAAHAEASPSALTPAGSGKPPYAPPLPLRG